MLTESLFADECEPFFNSIDPKRTFAGDVHPFRSLAWTSTMRRVGRGHAATKINCSYWLRGSNAARCSGTAESPDENV